MSLHCLVKHTMCQSVQNHSAASIKRHENIDSYGQTHHTKMFKVFAFCFDMMH